MRKRAHRICEEVVANLDVYLEQFIQQATANGIIVHRAAEASQAAAIVLEIARQNGLRLVAKLKV